MNCAKEGCEWPASWPSALCFSHRREAVAALEAVELPNPRKAGRPRTRKPSRTRLAQEGCDAMCDEADGWIVSCPNVVVWSAPESDPLGPLSYCGFHFLERVAAVASSSEPDAARVPAGSGLDGVAALTFPPEARRPVTATPRRDPTSP